MAVQLGGSVGRGGLNNRQDVMAVQRRLNALASRLGIAPLPTNGAMDSRTLAAIVEFQRRYVEPRARDGRIDPRGQSVRALGRTIGTSTPPVTRASVSPTAAAAATISAAPAARVTYARDVPADRRLASPYAIRVIERALDMAGLTATRITSTLRFPSEQASTMYDMASKNLQEQFQMYGNAGDEVLKVFRDNRAKPRAEVVALMERKINELGEQGIRVSLHVVSVEQYARLNVIDMGVNSTRAAAGTSFNETTKAAFTRALATLKRDGYIAKFIDETKKKNNCWHIEVKPDAKKLPW